MHGSRPTGVIGALVALALGLSGCAVGTSDESAESPSCDVPDADVSTAEGWRGYLAENPDEVSLVIDDGRGNHVESDADRERPAASAIKVVHLLAYATAVAEGRLDPAERIDVADWERYYHPADGGAHAAALERLDIESEQPAPGVATASDPSATVALDDLVSTMIQESDNAAPDYLRARLGDDALTAVLEDLEMTGTTVTSLLGMSLGAGGPDLGEEDPDALARRYLDDEEWAAEALATATGSYEVQSAYLAEHGSTTTADDLATAYTAIADGSLGEAGDLAREHLEWRGEADGITIGFKGGSLPGVLTDAMEIRQEDDAVGVAVILVEGMSEEHYAEAQQHFAWQRLLIDGVLDEDWLERVECVL